MSLYLDLLRLACVNLQSSIDTILAQKALTARPPQMNYDNYERAIVETYSVDLQGFPSGTVKNPGKLSKRKDIQQLLALLEGGGCAWVRLSDRELELRVASNKAREKRGDLVYKARKKSSRVYKKSAEIIDDDDDDDDENGRSEDDEMAS
jgi:hypothetical protein